MEIIQTQRSEVVESVWFPTTISQEDLLELVKWAGADKYQMSFNCDGTLERITLRLPPNTGDCFEWLSSPAWLVKIDGDIFSYSDEEYKKEFSKLKVYEE